MVYAQVYASTEFANLNYWLGILFSAGIATFGLIQNSPAVIIGRDAFTSNPPAAGSVALGTTSTLARLADNSHRATVTVKNTGTGTPQAVQMNVATLGQPVAHRLLVDRCL